MVADLELLPDGAGLVIPDQCNLCAVHGGRVTCSDVEHAVCDALREYGRLAWCGALLLLLVM